MDLLILANAADDVSAMETVPPDQDEVYQVVSGDSLDFDSWISLISEIENTHSDNVKAISSVYESFLSWFPLCHGYWKKYADHMARLCSVERAVEIFELAVQSATYSVGLWVDYCSFSILTFADPSDVRRIFERGLSFVGKDFLCHRLWDLYIRFELSQQQWSSLAHIIIRAQKFPSKSLHKYYDSFKEFAAFVEEDMSRAKSCDLEPYAADSNIQLLTSDDEISLAIKELQDSSSVDLRSKALNKLVAIGERFYNESCKLHEEIDYFENYMERDLFYVEPLDDEELQNWHNYLDFIEKQEDFDWAVKLYERCLIPCANYPEFWMRYVEFMESKGGRELANFALERATQVFLKNVSEVHIFNARFREKIGDIEGARAAFHLCDTKSDSSFIETAIKEANMETRLGNMDTALEIYDKALKVAAEKEKMHIFPILYIHFFRLKFLITGNADSAMDILIAGIQQVPYSRLLLEELINFAMLHEGSKHLDVVDSLIAIALSSEADGSEGLSSKDREDLSKLYLKFVDYCGTAHEIRKAWNRHIKYFPHLIRSNSSHKPPSNRILNELKEPRKKIPRLVAKPPSRDRSIKHISQISAKENKLLTSKSQLIEPHRPTANQGIEKDENNSLKENPCFQQSEDNSAGELEGSKHQPENASQNDLHVSQNHDEIRTEIEEHEHEVGTNLKPLSVEKEPNDLEGTMNPTTANQNPFPATDSSNKQTATDEHATDMQQISSQDMETCKTTHILNASEQVNPESNSMQPQNTSSASQSHLLPQNVQSMGQYPVQSGEQYNQFYQYQKQQQQQWLQMQQSYQQQQQSYIQQQQQLQPQHYQFYQQQLEQYQQYWFQTYQQQQQQHQLLEYNMQTQQYQQNPQHQVAAISNQMWNSSNEQQGQGTVSPYTTSTQCFVPHIQQNSVNVVAQPLVVSNRQQSSRSLHSPSVERTLET